jgi:hypothetical protein
VVKVWVNPIVVVPFGVCLVVSDEPPSVDEFDVKGEISIGDTVGTDVWLLGFDPIQFPFYFSEEVVFKTCGYYVDGICVVTIFFSCKSNIAMIQFDLLAA